MTKAQALEIFKFMLKSGKGTIDYWNGTIAEQRAAIEMAINALEQPKDETIKYLECNDIAVQEFIKAMKKQPLQAIQPNSTQLIFEMMNREISEDCVSRQAVLNTLFYKSDNNCEVVLNKELQDRIKALPPVTPTHGTCKDCKHNRPNSYARTMFSCERGNRFKLRDCENFYCADFEKRDNNKPKTYIDCQKCENYRNPDYSKCMECGK